MAKFTCPECTEQFTGITDSRPNEFGIWRRRICKNGHRFSTQETLCTSNGTSVEQLQKKIKVILQMAEGLLQ